MAGKAHWITWLFGLIGLGLLGGSLWAWSSSQSYISDGIRTTGTVIDLDYRDSDEGSGTYAPVVEFTDREGATRIYRSSSSSNPPAYRRGEQVTLYYMPGEPERAMIDSFSDRYLLPLILGVLGLAFSGIGFGMIYAGARKRAKVSGLKQRGLPIQADFVECHRDTRTKVNGRHPWRVVAQARHPASGKLEDFTSDMVWVDLTGELAGKRLTVLVDPQDPESYHIDLSEWLHDDEQG
ncbi:DUF3592 domain-containing protein [Altererythrobacter sp. MF3-039]|uniref:DUF3592 domain-containing protein n=1 Tax=Altererythrobacter sp. MF3-039 TaxID=3252901 RepID=UPI00390CA6B2